MTEPFAPPDWLGRTPYNSFIEYGDTASGHAWYSLPTWRRHCSLYDTHASALKGNARCLKAMRLYYLTLTTQRLKA